MTTTSTMTDTTSSTATKAMAMTETLNQSRPAKPTARLASQRGAVTVSFVLILPAMLAMAALVFDVAWHHIKSARLTDASELAALSVALSKTEAADEKNQRANTLLKLYQDQASALSQDIKGGIQVNSSESIEYLLADQFLASSADYLDLGKGAASKKSEPEYEIALVLDFSGSMTGQRLNDLKQAVNALLDQVNGNAWVSIVPYSIGASFVDAAFDNNKPNASQVRCARAAGCDNNGNCYLTNSSWSWASGVKIKDIPSQIFNSPDSQNITFFNKRAPDPWLSEQCSENPIIPLSIDVDDIKGRFADYQISGGGSSTTISYEGLIWGARALAQQWRPYWGIDPLPHDLKTGEDDTPKKHLILFTDGGDTGSHGYDFRDLVAAGLCQRIRENVNGMHYIAYQTSVNSYHQQCFGSVTQANNVGSLIATFQNPFKEDGGASKQLRLIRPI